MLTFGMSGVGAVPAQAVPLPAEDGWSDDDGYIPEVIPVEGQTVWVDHLPVTGWFRPKASGDYTFTFTWTYDGDRDIPVYGFDLYAHNPDSDSVYMMAASPGTGKRSGTLQTTWRLGTVFEYKILNHDASDMRWSVKFERSLKKLTASPTPKVSGSTTFGKTLTATPGTWKPAKVTLKYQWLRDGIAIPGATKKTYKLGVADIGTKVSVQVTGSKSGYNSVIKTSKATATIKAAKLTKTPRPKITGTARFGKTLTAKAGSWKPKKVTLAYQWYRDGSAIPGATKKTYKLDVADVGKKITVKVTGTKTGHTTVTKTSKATAKVKLATMTGATPKVVGPGGKPAKIGEPLSVQLGTWKPAGITYRYQWLRSDSVIPGATGPTYVVTNADRGKSIRVQVTGIKSGHTTVTKTSVKGSKGYIGPG